MRHSITDHNTNPRRLMPQDKIPTLREARAQLSGATYRLRMANNALRGMLTKDTVGPVTRKRIMDRAKAAADEVRAVDRLVRSLENS